MSKSTFDQKEQRVDQQQNADSIYNVSQTEKDSFEHEEVMHNASGAARALYGIGMIACFGTFFVFGAGMFTNIDILIPIAFGLFFVGMIMLGIGYSMARSQAYQRRVKSRRK
jgi:hypothetical protein